MNKRLLLTKFLCAVCISATLCLSIISNTGCRKTLVRHEDQADNYNSLLADSTPKIRNIPLDQLVIWKKPDSSNAQVREWIRKIKRDLNSDTTITSYYCGSCDSSLLLLRGPGLANFIRTELSRSGVKSEEGAPVTGDSGAVYYSLNYLVKHNDRSRFVRYPTKPLPSSPGEPVKIAVFDTGLQPGILDNHMYKSSATSCLRGAEEGWNFMIHNNDYRDDNSMRHGTIVSKFIVDQARALNMNPVEILPVKTHDQYGVSNMFNMLCGFAYAQERGVKIINASFGFYFPRRRLSGTAVADSGNVILMMKYINHYLTKNNILLVAAAGNRDDAYLKSVFEEYNWPYIPGNPRDLDEFCFYPASFARNPGFPNVVAVTTVNITNDGRGTVSNHQNYSPNVVNIGVVADRVTKDAITSEVHYEFDHPLLDSTEAVEGSSFATPVVTALLAANYLRFSHILNYSNGKPTYKTEDIWPLIAPGMISNNPGLTDRIKNGLITRRQKNK